MNVPNLLVFSAIPLRMAVAAIVVLCSVFSFPVNAVGNDPEIRSLHPFSFRAGERLTYTISWSNVFSAGTAVMEVQKSEDARRERLKFVSTAVTIGMVDKFYTVRDRVESVYDARSHRSIEYHVDQRHGKKKKKRDLLFDHEKGKVLYTADSDAPVSIDLQGHVHDALSSMYYLRSVGVFTVGKSIMIGIHDSGKNWEVEVQVLGRERIKTPAGEFETIKVRTYPKYEGVFMHKGEIYLWITDDARRVPVLMKSTITIGSIMATLTELKPGEDPL